MRVQSTTYGNTPFFFGYDQRKTDMRSKKGLDYTTFGAPMPGRSYSSTTYRYGFNGMLKDDEMHGNSGDSYDFGARTYDARLGRWLSTDPHATKYVGYSPYCFAANSPIMLLDADGKDPIYYEVYTLSNGKTSLRQVTEFDTPGGAMATNGVIVRYNGESWHFLYAKDAIAFSHNPDADIYHAGFNGMPGSQSSQEVTYQYFADHPSPVEYAMYDAAFGAPFVAQSLMSPVSSVAKDIVAVESAVVKKSAYQIATEGGANAGLIKNTVNQTDAMVQRGISKLARRVDEHKGYLANPEQAWNAKAIAQGKTKMWSNLSQGEKQGVIGAWQKEVELYSVQKEVLEGVLQSRQATPPSTPPTQ